MSLTVYCSQHFVKNRHFVKKSLKNQNLLAVNIDLTILEHL